MDCMSENSFKTIRNGAIASFVAGVALLAVPQLRGYAISFLAWVWSGVLWCWEALFTSYALPGWAWLLIFSLAIAGLGRALVVFREVLAAPEYCSYVEDHLYDAKWKWRWVEQRIHGLWCYCPRCDATLVYNDDSCRDFRSNKCQTKFVCENCSRVVATIDGGDKSYAVGAVKREIARRIRTNEYKKALTTR